jgi:hypothetical protein
MAPAHGVGNPQGGGDNICVGNYLRGIYPNRIEARADVNMLRWVKVSFTDGSEKEFGKNPGLDGSGRGGIVAWNPWNDHFTEFKIAGDGWAGGTGRIKAQVAGAAMDAGGYRIGDLQDISQGNQGMLLGFSLRQGDGIDYLEPFFTESAYTKAKLLNATFEPSFEHLNQLPYSQRQMTALQAVHSYDNTASASPGTLNIDASIMTEVSTKVSNSHEVGSELTHEFGLGFKREFSFDVRLPFIGKVESKFSPETSYKYSDKRLEKKVTGEENGTSKTEAVRYRSTHDVPAGGYVTCVVTVLQSKVDLMYRATLQNILASGKTWEFPVEGRFESASHSDAKTQCFDVDPETFYAQYHEGLGARSVEHPEVHWADSLSGTYCANGTRVSDSTGLSDEEYANACGLAGITVIPRPAPSR